MTPARTHKRKETFPEVQIDWEELFSEGVPQPRAGEPLTMARYSDTGGYRNSLSLEVIHTDQQIPVCSSPLAGSPQHRPAFPASILVRILCKLSTTRLRDTPVGASLSPGAGEGCFGLVELLLVLSWFRGMADG